MVNISDRDSSLGLRVGTVFENNNLRHVFTLHGLACIHAVDTVAAATGTSEVKANLPLRSPTAELTCGWWLLVWLDSSIVFSMTEPARSARSNSFRKCPQVTSCFGGFFCFVFYVNSSYKSGWFTGWSLKMNGAHRKLVSKEDSHLVKLDSLRTAMKLCPNFPAAADWLSQSNQETHDTHNPMLFTAAAAVRLPAPVIRAWASRSWLIFPFANKISNSLHKLCKCHWCTTLASLSCFNFFYLRRSWNLKSYYNNKFSKMYFTIQVKLRLQLTR